MHKGNHSLSFVIYDDEDSIKVNLKSRKQKIKISQELLSDLDSRKVFYKLN
jgi:DNA polymerase-3 subunit alpha